MALCRCGAEAPCLVHPTRLKCELCKRREATHWTVEQRYHGATGLDYYEAIPVCDEDVPRVASGDRPDDLIAVAPLGLIGNASWV